MDNMEKELWDAFYGKESKQERCSVLTEAELNKHNKGILNEDFEVQPDLLDNEYDVTYKNGRRVYDFHTIYKALENLLPDWDYTGDAYNGDELNLIYQPKNSKASLNKEMLSDLRKAMAEKFGNDVIVRVGRSQYAPEQKKLFIGYLDSGDDYNIPEEELDEGRGKKKKKALKENMNSSSPKMKKFGHFNVAVVFPNEKSVGRPRYTNTYGTEVEFYDDNNHEGFGPYGQFVSSYLLDTLLGKSEYSDNDGTYPYGLQLHGNSPNWSVPAETMSEIIDWLKQFDNETLRESAEPVYISVDVTRHNGSVIVKSDEFGKITYLPNDFEKLEDTIKRAVNDYAAENNIAEYEVIKLYESKKALKEDYEEDYEEDEELTPVDADSLDVDEFYNGYVMDNAALWDEDIDYDAIEANKNQIFQYWKQLVKGGEDEWDAVEISVRRFASNEELDEGCGKKKKKALKESDDLWSQIQNYKKKYGEPEIAQSGFDYYRYAKELYNGEPEEAIYGPGDIMKDLFNKASYLGDTLSTNEWNRIAEYVYGMCKERLPKVRIPNSLIAETSSKKNLKEVEDMSDIEAKLNKTIDAEMKKFPKYAADAKKALDDGDEIKKILNKYNQEYNFLYNNHDKVAGYEEAVRAWDEYINHPDFRELIGKVIKARHDMFTSDREIGALMFALDALGYLDKFDGKESSLEPVVKEFKMNESEEKTNKPIVDLDSIVRKLKNTKGLTLSQRIKIMEPYNLTPEQEKYVLDELHGVSRGHAYLYGPSEF